ncbi:MAG: TIGR00296 family protein [Nanobdellota archaeon]
MSPEEGKQLLILARQFIVAAVTEQKYPKSEDYTEKRGVFVTLTRDGELRGCIGFPEPIFPLGKALGEAAVSAAKHDPRFPPVQPEELDKIRVEISILTQPQEIHATPEELPEKVRVGTDGLIVENPHGRGLLLPQVPGEFGWDAHEFLCHTCIKAGLEKDAWKDPETRILCFQAEIFSEGEK